MTKRDSSASAACAPRGTDSKDSRTKRSLDLKIETAPVASLRAYEKNARTHSDKQVAQIKASIERFGFVNPILVDDDNVVIAGHGRLEAAKLLGMEEAPIARLSHLTPAEVRAYRLADNKLAELSGWDQDLLRIELGALVEIDFDIELTGFATPEIDLLLEPAGAKGPSQPDPDDELVAPDQKMAAVSRTGDLWELGKHRLICGDALAPETYAALMGDERADMVMTDPPYNVRV
ncbi:MAG: ParB N-terminal domain-containing protein, partial [Amphiplicatus sp.]|nr:ParB N-terminal domain-containing protein [Amphiplicatus sp.]